MRADEVTEDGFALRRRLEALQASLARARAELAGEPVRRSSERQRLARELEAARHEQQEEYEAVVRALDELEQRRRIFVAPSRVHLNLLE